MKTMSQKAKSRFRKNFEMLFRKSICLILSVATLLGTFAFGSYAGELKGDDSTSSTLEEMQALVGTLSYTDYSKDHEANRPGLSEIALDVTKFTGDAYLSKDSEAVNESREDTPDAWKNFGDQWDNTVYLPTTNATGKQAGSASWTFTITAEQVGLYYLQIEYYNCITSESSISSIQRKLKIDNRIPFSEVSTLAFDQHWVYSNSTVGEVLDVDASENLTVGSFISYQWDNDSYRKTVTKVWEEGGKLKKQDTVYTISQDINGNSMKPENIESAEWSTYICSDTTGYHHGYFAFSMSEGTHTITLEAEREPMIIKSITLVPAYEAEALPTYDAYMQNLKDKYNASAAVNGYIVQLEAEFPDAVSDSSVAASNDNTSAITYPVSSQAQKYNVIGENGYSTVGQWAAYKFTVNETGLYNFSMRFKQTALEGMFICRTIKLSGGVYGLADGSPSVPFQEAYNAQFNYSKDWQSAYVSDGSGEAFEFYFEKGVEYTLYLECSLGALREQIQKVELSLSVINECYLKILQRTGSDPDEHTSYDFHKSMPEVLINLLNEAINLTTVKEELRALCGSNGAPLATLDTIARVLDTMGSNEGRDIAANMETLKTYLGTLGTWINDSKRSAMTVDSISVVPAGSDTSAIPRANANFFEAMWFEISSFIYSFFTRYDQMGLTRIPDADTATIDVWLASGRDQSNIWRQMIDAKDGFTDTTGNAVTLKLVTGGTLLPSILSGKGPDVYLGLGSADVINYAIRDAIIGVGLGDEGDATQVDKAFLTNYYKDASGKIYEFTDEELATADLTGLTLVSESFDSYVADTFAPAAMDTLRLRDITYGIPMTMSFSMMFYRMDILAELGQEVPESWDELLALLPVLQQKNMSIGVSYIAALDFMMYQKGGSMWKYTDNSIYKAEDAGAKIDLDSDIALEAFQFTCRLYTDYSFPVTYDSANRFRTGEMPIVIGDYASIYNTLVVYATEISGLWEFSSLPGSIRDDGTYNYDSLAGVSATVILHGCDNILAAWQFTQWQTSAEIQSGYGNGMVALIGPSAKYETANLDAIKDLSWTAKERAAIMNQMDNLSSIVNYPGSYIYSRYMKFAFLDAYNDGADPHDAMMSYIDAINAEITRKREEFNLPVYGPSEEPVPKNKTSD